jgi:hypothetical protein
MVLKVIAEYLLGMIPRVVPAGKIQGVPKGLAEEAEE